MIRVAWIQRKSFHNCTSIEKESSEDFKFFTWRNYLDLLSISDLQSHNCSSPYNDSLSNNSISLILIQPFSNCPFFLLPSSLPFPLYLGSSLLLLLLLFYLLCCLLHAFLHHPNSSRNSRCHPICEKQLVNLKKIQFKKWFAYSKFNTIDTI